MNKEFSDRFETRQLAIKNLSDKYSISKPENNNPRSRIFSEILNIFKEENNIALPKSR